MARKTVDVVIPTPEEGEDRDAGKIFRITEMGAMPTEKWAMRAFLALARSGVEVPEDIAAAGLAGVASMGLKAFAGVNYYDAEPLLAEMMACVQIVEPAKARALTGDDIEEVSTLLLLRAEAFKLHVDFSKLAALSRRIQAKGTAGALI